METIVTYVSLIPRGWNRVAFSRYRVPLLLHVLSPRPCTISSCNLGRSSSRNCRRHLLRVSQILVIMASFSVACVGLFLPQRMMSLCFLRLIVGVASNSNVVFLLHISSLSSMGGVLPGDLDNRIIFARIVTSIFIRMSGTFSPVPVFKMCAFRSLGKRVPS